MNTTTNVVRFGTYRDTKSGIDVIVKIIPFGSLDKQFIEDTKSMAQHEDDVSYNAPKNLKIRLKIYLL